MCIEISVDSLHLSTVELVAETGDKQYAYGEYADACCEPTGFVAEFDLNSKVKVLAFDSVEDARHYLDLDHLMECGKVTATRNTKRMTQFEIYNRIT